MILAFIWGRPAHFTKHLVFWALLIIMVFSIAEIDLSKIIKNTTACFFFKETFNLLIVNYLFLGGIIWLLTYFLIDDRDLYRGFILMATIPSAVAVVPFSYLLGGDEKIALIGTVSLYFCSLFISPLVAYFLLGVKGVILYELIKVLLLIILLPIFLSRILIRMPFYKDVKPASPIIINLGFFIVIYSVIGLNRELFFSRFDLLSIIILIAIIRTFGTGYLMELWGRIIGMSIKKRITYIFFAGYKNLGLTATVALIIFNPKTTVPSAACIFLELIFFISASFYYKKIKKT